MIKVKKLPKKISPCPILEAIIEIRFESKYPAEAVFGVLYNDFSKEFSQRTNLPILQIPEAIRLNDQNLLYKPYHQLAKDNYLLQVGPRVIALNNKKEYSGWDSFSKKFVEYFKIAKQLNIFKSIKRLGLRYINFFEFNIYENSDINVEAANETLIKQRLMMQTMFEFEDFKSDLRISNNSSMVIDGKTKKGSIIDIDTYLEKDGIDIDRVGSLIEKGHSEEKKIFFGSLKQEFIDNQLNPVY